MVMIASRSFDCWQVGIYSGVSSGKPGGQAACLTQTLPDPSYSTTPTAAPLRNVVGFSAAGGTNIYGPFDAGFSLVRQAS